METQNSSEQEAIEGMLKRCGQILVRDVLKPNIDMGEFIASLIILKPHLIKNTLAVADTLSDQRIVELVAPPITMEKLNEFFDDALKMVVVRSMKEAGLKKIMQDRYNSVDN